MTPGAAAGITRRRTWRTFSGGASPATHFAVNPVWYATVAYDAATGAQLWASYYTAARSFAGSLAVGPHGHTVYVTGRSTFYATTVAYNAATGAELWVNGIHQRHHLRRHNAAAAVAVSP